MIDEWLDLPVLVAAEIDQLRQEGHDVADLAAEFAACAGDGDDQRRALEDLYVHLDERAAAGAEHPDEPSTLTEILAAAPVSPATAVLRLPADAELRDRMEGIWLGRCIGCILGKPVEGLHGHVIRRYLTDAGAWPLSDYVPAPEGLPSVTLHPSFPTTTRPNIRFAERDDDIDYPILNLTIRERLGDTWSTEDVAEAWLTNLPYLGVFTAERAVYRNLVDGIAVADAAVVRNPYREWIGAQIRADVWGLSNPGDPAAAAAEAYRDAVLSHRRNGIYGEMMVAAMLAAAMATDDVSEVVRQGLAVVPERSRLALAVKELIGWHAQFSTWEGCWEQIDNRWGDHHWIHTIPNALVLVMGLLYGQGDFGQTISITVMGGWDTDSNGASAGAIAGALTGASRIPARWSEPLGDTVRSFIPGFDNTRISSLAERSWRLIRQPGRPGSD